MSGLFAFLPGDFLPRDRRSAYEKRFHVDRLNRQQRAVWNVVKDGRWRGLSVIAVEAGIAESSASACLRDFRKMGVRVDRKRIDAGGFFYRVRPGAGEEAIENTASKKD